MFALGKGGAEDALEVVRAGGEEHLVRVHVPHLALGLPLLLVGHGEHDVAPLRAVHHLRQLGGKR